MSRVDDQIRIILKRKDLTKDEKLKKMYVLVRKSRPQWDKYDVYETCKSMYEKHRRIKTMRDDEYVIY